ncbi:MAG: APC family permease, partial [Pseudomonadota bacterium]|nr:APC family permease [Pseudomonadota bacterium]
MRQPLKKDAGISALISACLGSIVGSGWLFGPFHAAQIAGPYSLIAWVIGALAISLLAMVYAELSTVMPLSGAVIHFPRISHGELTARIYGWINFLGYVCIAPVETIAILAYSNNFWPGLTTSSGLLTPKGLACAIILLAAFTSLNFLSIRWVLRINNWSIWWKLAIPIITIITLTLWSGHTSNLFIDHQPIKKSWPRILHAIADSGIIFSFLGFRQAVELSGESQNPSRSLPLSIIGSVGIGLILYLGLQFAFLISIPPSSLSNGWTELKFSGMAGPFAGLAAIAGLSWLVKLLYIDAIISPGGTSFIYLTTSARVTL